MRAVEVEVSVHVEIHNRCDYRQINRKADLCS